ncbi:MAG: hypothetical protein R3F37_19195 [Candidatus Competibacteraceae bacterium]
MPPYYQKDLSRYGKAKIAAIRVSQATADAELHASAQAECSLI